MRQVRISASVQELFQIMLVQGAEKFGVDVAVAKERLVFETLERVLKTSPHRGRYDPALRLYFYGVTDTPFMLVYEYDDIEVRVFFILHQRSDLNRIDRRSVTW